jgi:hypothetical protein
MVIPNTTAFRFRLEVDDFFRALATQDYLSPDETEWAAIIRKAFKRWRGEFTWHEVVSLAYEAMITIRTRLSPANVKARLRQFIRREMRQRQRRPMVKPVRLILETEDGVRTWHDSPVLKVALEGIAHVEARDLIERVSRDNVQWGRFLRLLYQKSTFADIREDLGLSKQAFSNLKNRIEQYAKINLN